MAPRVGGLLIDFIVNKEYWCIVNSEKCIVNKDTQRVRSPPYRGLLTDGDIIYGELRFRSQPFNDLCVCVCLIRLYSCHNVAYTHKELDFLIIHPNVRFLSNRTQIWIGNTLGISFDKGFKKISNRVKVFWLHRRVTPTHIIRKIKGSIDPEAALARTAQKTPQMVSWIQMYRYSRAGTYCREIIFLFWNRMRCLYQFRTQRKIVRFGNSNYNNKMISAYLGAYYELVRDTTMGVKHQNLLRKSSTQKIRNRPPRLPQWLNWIKRHFQPQYDPHLSRP